MGEAKNIILVNWVLGSSIETLNIVAQLQNNRAYLICLNSQRFYVFLYYTSVTCGVVCMICLHTWKTKRKKKKTNRKNKGGEACLDPYLAILTSKHTIYIPSLPDIKITHDSQCWQDVSSSLVFFLHPPTVTLSMLSGVKGIVWIRIKCTQHP